MSIPTLPGIAGPDKRPGLKARLRAKLQSKPALWSIYWRGKQELKRVVMLRFFAYDIAHTYRAMFWPEGHDHPTTLSAELLFQYHKLEKGLVMPGRHRMFGRDPALATLKLAQRWIESGHPRNDPVFVGALETLAAYRRRLLEFQLDPTGAVLGRVSGFLSNVEERDSQLQTPRMLPLPEGDGQTFGSFAELALARRSVREFLPEPVGLELIEKAVASAQLAPSACNRQPCHVFLYSDPERKRELLSYQNGNRGFGHMAPHVAIITADEQCFFDASERHQPYIDGGLFSMSLVLALRDLGIASCCLNWCVPPANDKAVHRLFAIPESHRIIMLMAIGREPAQCMVPRSPRRRIANVLHLP
jgi:nitroreductase